MEIEIPPQISISKKDFDETIRKAKIDTIDNVISIIKNIEFNPNNKFDFIYDNIFDNLKALKESL